MTKLSVNINKFATIRNSRGGNNPDIIKAAIDCQRFGADGITVHPRPDERHIKRQDVFDIRPVITTEFNIEGYPSRDFIDLVLGIRPHQVTLVPDAHDAITSNAGWDTVKHKSFLKEIVKEFKNRGIRTSIFVDTILENVISAAETGTDRIELYTEPFAAFYHLNKQKAVDPFVKAAKAALEVGLELNAGHDLSLENLKFFCDNIPAIKEVSIGHALVCDAIYLGLENTIKMYQALLPKTEL